MMVVVSTGHQLLEPAVKGAVEDAITRNVGRKWTSETFTDLEKRASHPAGVFHGESLSVFAKASFVEDGDKVFTAELAGLELLHKRTGVTVPVPIGPGLIELDDGWLLLYEAVKEEPPESRTSDDWSDIGHTLAAIHQVHADRFGLPDFNGYFGPLPQDNSPNRSNRWVDFYAERRVLPFLRSAVDSGQLPLGLASQVELVVRRLPSLGGPEPQPTLLHGDAQQHNFVSTDDGAVVIDVAPYFGHPELDLALVDWVRPVPDVVFDAYREVLPIDPEFAERRELWRVFGYLAGVAVGGGPSFGRFMLRRLTDAVGRYR
jgi:fructosamine-3-kinase